MTSRVITLGPGLKLPIDAVTQTLGAIGRKGAGKTYLAQLIAEQMLDAEAQVVALDPVGNWFGLRLGADGRSRGKEIFVLGGEHGDVPLTPESGARIARLLTEKRVSAVLDLSAFRQGERKRFAWEFAEEFFHRKKTQRSAVHVFVEEAQLFIPQRVGPDEARMVGAFENIIRLGRNYGIGTTLVTQRPQSVNKEVLSQVECLCVLQVNGTHERKALEEWVQEAGADRKLVGELPGLGQGEGYVWSPSWLRTFQRVQFGKKTTFDASATPEVGQASKAATLASVDVEALRKDLAEVVSKAEADDPKALRRRIVELERDLKSRAKGATLSARLEVPKPPRVVERPVISDPQLGRLSKAVEQLSAFEGKLVEYAAIFRAQLQQAIAINQGKHDPVPVSRPPLSRPVSPVSTRPLSTSARTVARADQDTDISRPQQKILDALFWFEEVARTERPTRRQVALVAGVSAVSSGYENNISALKTAGLISYPSGGLVQLTDDGRAKASDPDTALTNEALQESLFGRLTGPQAKLLRALIRVYPASISRLELAAMAEVSAVSSGYENNVSALRSLGLIDYPAQGYVVASQVLFPEAEP